MSDFKTKRILVIDLLYLGDLLFATPFFKNLRANYPQARIDFVGNANFTSLLEDASYFDNIYSYDKNWGIKKSWQFARKIAQNDYQLGINLHGNWRTAILLRLIAPDYSVGFAGKGRGIFLDDQFQRKKGLNMVELYLNALQELGLKMLKSKSTEIRIKAETKLKIKQLLAEKTDNNKVKIVLNTGGSWSTKRWPKEKFADLADMLQQEYDYQVIFVGGPGDVARVEKTMALMSGGAFNLAGKTNLKELAAVAGEADLFISGDTGPAHVAAAMQTTVCCIFGPSDEQKYFPYSKPHRLVSKKLDCRPCGQHQCPLGHHNCMELITADEIKELVGGLIG